MLALEPTAYKCNVRTKEFGTTTTSLMSKVKAAGKMNMLMGGVKAAQQQGAARTAMEADERARVAELAIFGQAGGTPGAGEATVSMRQPPASSSLDPMLTG